MEHTRRSLKDSGDEKNVDYDVPVQEVLEGSISKGDRD